MGAGAEMGVCFGGCPKKGRGNHQTNNNLMCAFYIKLCVYKIKS